MLNAEAVIHWPHLSAAAVTAAAMAALERFALNTSGQQMSLHKPKNVHETIKQKLKTELTVLKTSTEMKTAKLSQAKTKIGVCVCMWINKRMITMME